MLNHSGCSLSIVTNALSKGAPMFTCSHPAHAGRSYPASYAPAHAIYAHTEPVEMVEADA